MSHFNLVANSWDTPEKIELSKHYAQKILHLSKNKTPKKILEVGCGTGLLGANFLNENSSLLGVDTSEGMLKVFEEKFKGLNAKSLLLNLEKEDFEDSIKEKSFDLIISSMSFHHIKDPEKIILKLKKYLASEGTLAIIDLDKEDGSFHPDPKNMGVFHFGFSDETTKSWAQLSHFETYSRECVHTIYKNEKNYPLFLAAFS